MLWWALLPKQCLFTYPIKNNQANTISAAAPTIALASVQVFEAMLQSVEVNHADGCTVFVTLQHEHYVTLRARLNTHCRSAVRNSVEQD